MEGHKYQILYSKCVTKCDLLFIVYILARRRKLSGVPLMCIFD